MGGFDLGNLDAWLGLRMSPRKQDKRSSEKHLNCSGGCLLSTVLVTDVLAHTLRDTSLFRLEMRHSAVGHGSSLLMPLAPGWLVPSSGSPVPVIAGDTGLKWLCWNLSTDLSNLPHRGSFLAGVLWDVCLLTLQFQLSGDP